MCLNCDYVVAEGSTTFEHGNLGRGVCPLGGLSRTLPHVAGRARALAMYLGNDSLSAAEAQTAGVVHEVRKRLHRSSNRPQCHALPCSCGPDGNAPLTQVCNGGIAATQRRALAIARQLAAPASPPPHDAPGHALVKGRARVDAALLDAEAAAHAACLAAGASLHKSASSSVATDSRAPLPLALLRPFTPAAEAATQAPSRSNRGAAHVVRVPRHLGGDGAPLPTWPDGVLPVFRGANPEHFCLGGSPAADPNQQSAFLNGLPAFAELHGRLARAALPSVVVCHGATRGGGMLFPCLGTLAQHVEKGRLGSEVALPVL